jgi:branched-chain amino acid transport system substrate-binding protein
VNAGGGLQVGDQKMMLEFVEYDDKTSDEDAIRNIKRLANVDEVDFIVTPNSTGLDVATAPMVAQYGYPQPSPTGWKNSPLRTWLSSSARPRRPSPTPSSAFPIRPTPSR